ncbi:MAG: SurA N-terminal domain-containing protein [Spirochaetales bacterium]|nr:SurA N-terminal domain-containing protein [Spirochaetales bacterium]
MASKSDKNGLHLVDEKHKEKKPTKNRFMFAGSIAILVLIVVTFIGAPAIGSFSSTSNRLIFGYYDGEPIEYRSDNYFARQQVAIAEQYQQNMSNDDSTGFNLEFQRFQIWRQAFEQTATHIALLSMAEKSGVSFTEDQIDNEVVTNGPYMGSDGLFDENRYLETSNTLRKTNRTFVTESMVKNEAVSQIFTSKISTGEKEFIKTMSSPERKFRYAVFPYSEYPAEIITDYAQENSSLFKKISLSRIALYESEEDALAIYAAITADPSLFEEEARNKSQDSFASKGGAMGSYANHELRSFFDKTEDLDRIMDMKAGEISDLVVNEDGWFIYRCDEPAVSIDLENSEELDSVRIYIQRYERGQMEDYFTAQGTSFAAKASSQESSFVEAANEMKISYHDTDFFPVIYGNIGFSFYGTEFPLFKGISVSDGDTTLQYTKSDINVLETMAALSIEAPISAPLILDEAVVVLQLLEEQDAPEDSTANTDFYYDYAIGSWKENQLSEGLLTSDKLIDNFYEEFGKLISE